MITIKKNGKFIIPEHEVFIGHAGDNLNVTKEFFVEDVTDVSLVYRMYLQFDDGTTNFFLIDSEPVENGTKLTWNVTDDQIYKSGILKMQIKASNSSGIVFHSAITSLVVHKSIEFGEAYKNKENSEFLHYEEVLNGLIDKERQTMEELRNLASSATGGVDMDSEPVKDSTKAVTSGGIYNALANKLDDTDNSVKPNNIQNSSVGLSKLDSNLVTTSDNSAQALAFANDTTIPTTKLVKGWINGQIEDLTDSIENKLDDADNSVKSNHISNGSIDASKLAVGSVTESKLEVNLLNNILGVISGVDVLDTAVANLKTSVENKLDDADNSVKSNNIQNNAVGLSKLDRNLVTTSDNSAQALAFANDTTIPTTKLVKGWIESGLENIDNSVEIPLNLEWEKGSLSTNEDTLGQEAATSSHLRTGFQNVSLFDNIYFDITDSDYRYNIFWYNEEKSVIGYLDLGTNLTHNYNAKIEVPENAVCARFILWKNGGISLGEESVIAVTGIADDGTAYLAENIRKLEQNNLADEDNSVKNNNIADAAVTEDKIADGAIGINKLSSTLVSVSGDSSQAWGFANDKTIPTTKLVKAWIQSAIEEIA